LPLAALAALTTLLATLLAALLSALTARILLLLTGFLLAALLAALLPALLPALILIHVRHRKHLLIAGRPRKAPTNPRGIGSEMCAELSCDLKLMVHKNQ
jgi:hypothetical protein